MITRRRDNGLLTIGPFNDGALISPHAHRGRYCFSSAETRRRGKRNSIFPVHPFDTHDSVICEFLGASDVLSELGWEMPVDLKADAHFDECRSCP